MESQPRHRFLPRGIVEDEQGRIAGMWVRDRRGRKRAYMLEEPVERVRNRAKVVTKNIIVDGRELHNVPVQVLPEVNAFSHWNKYPKK